VPHPPADPYPPPRRRAGLVVGIVIGCLVMVGAVVFGLLIGTSKSRDAQSSPSGPTLSNGGPPDLPAACDLLSPEEVADLLGETQEPLSDRPPEKKEDGRTVTTCQWSTGEMIMDIDISAQPSVEAAEAEYQSQLLTCDTSENVKGADEACYITTTSDAAGGVRVIARAGRLIVDFTYTTNEPLSDSTVDIAIEATSTLIDILS